MAEEKEKEKSVVKTTRPLVRGPLKPPRPRAPDASYTQPPHKKDVYIAQTGKKAEDPLYQQVSLTTLPHPFIEPADAFARLDATKS